MHTRRQKNFGLQALEFDRYVQDETASIGLQSYDFTGPVNLDMSPKATKAYTNVDHWMCCHYTKNEWIGYHLQDVLEQELNACMSYIRKEYLFTLVENLDLDINSCEETICAVEREFCAELRLFVTDKDQHKVLYPDTIWVFPNHQFVRPKL